MAYFINLSSRERIYRICCNRLRTCGVTTYNMKRLLFVLTLGAALACPAMAQPADSTSTNAPPDGPPPGEHHHDHDMKFLTDAEKAELKKAHDAAIAGDPSLKTEEDSIHATMKADHEAGTPPSDADKATFEAFRDKMDKAMIAADPAVEPILAKIKAHHHGGPGGHGGDGGTPPPAPSAQ